jgi:uncharacterized membrane protein
VKSRAAIGDHPLHPAIVPLPIGCFFLALVADVLHAATKNVFWYDVAHFALGLGILTALCAAVLGFIDFFGVKMSMAGWRLAKWHMGLNLTAVVLYALGWLIRRDHAAVGTDRWLVAFGLEVVPFLILGVSGWLGGKMSYEHKVGVVETGDPEATEIGLQEAKGKKARS